MKSTRFFLFVSLIPVLQMFTLDLSAQSFLQDSNMLVLVQQGVEDIYQFDFDSVDLVQEQLDRHYPDHPVTFFWTGLTTYWMNYPLMPGRPGSRLYETSMTRSWELAEAMKKGDPQNLEGVFFNMMARSFAVMYYADNGRPRRVIPHILPVYREIIKGYTLKEAYNEFYFLVGLYNYYREAWPEAYPVYKPATVFLKKGDKATGLKWLHFAAEHTSFMKVEAAMFLTLIYLNFEHDIESALSQCSRIQREFPGNPYITGKLVELLVLDRQYDSAETLNNKLKDMNEFSDMRATIYQGLIEEKGHRDMQEAVSLYRMGLKKAEAFGDYANYIRAYAFLGLSRYYDWAGDRKQARYYWKKARGSTGFDYLFEEQKDY